MSPGLWNNLQAMFKDLTMSASIKKAFNASVDSDLSTNVSVNFNMNCFAEPVSLVVSFLSLFAEIDRIQEHISCPFMFDFLGKWESVFNPGAIQRSR